MFSQIKRFLGFCEEEGCWQRGNVYFVDDHLAEKVFKYCYCVDHAGEAGFCFMCGNFWGGVESFDFSRIKGICENCIDEFDYEYGTPEHSEYEALEKEYWEAFESSVASQDASIKEVGAEDEHL